MRRAALLVAVVALAGCGGGKSDSDQASDALAPLGLSMAEGAVYQALDAGDVALLYRRSRAYAFAVQSRVEKGQLDEGEARTKLLRVSDDVRLDCAECATVLDRAADDVG